MKLSDKELKHLKTVIDYLYCDESRNYEDEGQPQDHVFVSVLGLQEILWRGSPAPQAAGEPMTTSDEIEGMRQQNPAFDADERRREKLAGIMQANPTMTTEQALHWV